tara:strand:+ start:1272 stop:2258 length:987 start_codon:yes stop_codon:yes gene_type:complete
MARFKNSFSSEDAAVLIDIAKLPETYEAALFKTDSHESALAAMHESAPANLQDNINLFRVENTTAVTAYDEQTNSLTIAFDPTLSKGTVFNNADKWDNFTRGKEPHSLGGEVHGGLYSDLVKPHDGTLPGDNMVDVINSVIYDYASRTDQDLKVNFTGFSKGGAQAALAAGEVVSTGIFDDNPNIKLNNVYSFAPPGYGDQTYIDNFNAQAESLGANAWTIELHGDILPTILTPEGGNYFTQYDYNQFGNRAYLTNTDDGIQINENPTSEELTALRAAPVDGNNYHNSKSYVAAVQAVKETEQPNNPNAEPPIQINLLNTPSATGFEM